MAPARTLLWYLLSTSIGIMTATATEPVDPLGRENLLMFHGASGKIGPVHATGDWLQRRAEILAAMQTVTGPLPGPERRVPLDVQLVRETDCGSYVRREISFMAEPGSRVPAFLLVPKAVRDGNALAPGILCLMPTNEEGHRVVVGLGSDKVKPGRNYGEELVLRGFVVIAPPYPLLADYRPDLRTLGYQSGTMKAVWDNIRALDVLAATPGVAAGGFGAIGHSLGAHNAIFTAVFDDRIKVVVSSCGFDSFQDYMDDSSWRPGKGWAQERYMPRILEYSRSKIPFDFPELLGALAPRAVLAIAPTGDANFHWQSVDRIVAAARDVYGLYGEGDRLKVLHPDCPHDFPPEMREAAYAWLARFLR